MSVGPLTIERHTELSRQGVHLHVFYRGEDVTDRCKFVDDTPETMVAWLYKHDEQGRKYLDPETRAPAMEIVREGIEIRGALS